MSDTFGLKIGIEGEKAFKQSLREINNDFKVLGSEMKLATSEFDQNERSIESLTATNRALENQIAAQKSKVETLTSALDNASASFGENDKRTKAWQVQLNNATADLNKMERELSANEKAVDELSDEMNSAAKNTDKLGDEIKESGNIAESSKGAFENLGSGLKGIGTAIGVSVKAIGAGIVAVGGSFAALAEGTRETRENMGKLETGFTTAGHSAEDAKNTYAELYGILGDNGQATEAASHLAKLTNNQEELAQWTDIATGVYATFGDSLPIENLAEASNETAKTGQITGGLADALNWAGVSEDEFQASLDKCTTEQERQALITETMNGLYAEASEKYKQVNGDIIAAQKATADFNNTMAELGAIAEPIITSLKVLVTGLLCELIPFFELVGTGFSGLIEGTEGAAETFATGLSGMIALLLEKVIELLPMVIDIGMNLLLSLIDVIVANLPMLLDVALQMITTIVTGIAKAIPILIPTIVSLVVQTVNTLLDNLPMVLDAALQLLTGFTEGILNAIPVLLKALPQVIDSLVSFLLNSIPMIIETGVQLLTSLVEDLPVIITTIVEAIPEIVENLIDAVIGSIPLIVDSGIKLLVALIQALPTIITTVVTAIPQIVTSLVTAIIGNIDKIIAAGVQLLIALIANLPVIIAEIIKAVPQIVDGIVSTFEGLLYKMNDAGANIAKGLWNGIQSMSSWLISQVTAWASSIWNTITGFFDIHSPSRKTAWAGKMLVEGFANSISQYGNSAVSQTKKMSKDVLSCLDSLNAEKISIPIDYDTSLNGLYRSLAQGVPASFYPAQYNAPTVQADAQNPINITQNIYAQNTSYAEQQRQALKSFKQVARAF